MNRVLLQNRAQTLSERNRLDLQRSKASSFSPLRAQVDEALRHMSELKEQGVKHEPLNKLIESKTGTISFAEWMGF